MIPIRHSELTILQHLSEVDSLDVLAAEGFDTPAGQEVIPTDLVRRMVGWTLVQYFDAARVVAPSPDAIRAAWADQLEAAEIAIDFTVEPDSVQWAIGDLRATYAWVRAQDLVTEFVTQMAEVDQGERVKVFSHYADEFFTVSQSLVTRRNQVTGAQGMAHAAQRLDERVRSGKRHRGIKLGIAEVDTHKLGTHPGEITTIAAPPGGGKSWLAGFITYHAWADEAQQLLLVTLENDVPMTSDRLCCMAAGIRYEDWQAGTITSAEREHVALIIDKMAASDRQPIITQLDPSQRTPEAIMRKAMLEGVDGVVIDQLHFLHSAQAPRGAKRYEQATLVMHSLKSLANEGAQQLPVIVFSQLNREGIRAGRKNGRYEMDDLADSTSVEQTSDDIWAIFQSPDLRADRAAHLLELKARRTTLKHFELSYQPEIGLIRSRREITLT